MRPRTLDARVVRRGFRILWMSIRTEPRPFAAAVLGASLYAVMTVGSAVVFGQVTDRVVLPAFERGEAQQATLAIAAAVILGVAVLKAAGIVLRRAAASLMQFKLQAGFRHRIAEQYLRLPMSWHRKHSTGELLSRANADVEATFWPIAPLPLSTGVVVMLVVAAVVLLATDWVLALVGFALGPAIAVANARYNRLTVAPATEGQELRADVSEVAHESFDGALVVKTLGRERDETRRFEVESERLRDVLIELGRLRAMYNPVMESLPNLAVLTVLALGAWRISTGHVTVGDVVLVSYLFTLLAFPVRVIGYLFQEFPRAIVGWRRVRDVLDPEDRIAYGSAALPTASSAAPVDLDEVSFRHEPGDEAILDDLSFGVPPGSTIAIVGPTGAGKSTIANLLARLSDPDAGEVRVDDRDLRTLAFGQVSANVAVVFQESFLFDDSLADNITLGQPYDPEDVHAAARLAEAHAFVSRTVDGYDTVVGERGTTLSGGQRQRIALARALVRRPRVLVLDDATSSVDPHVEQRILANLKDADLPSTVILIAYREATIALADEVLFVEEGRIAARGTHGRLLEEVPAYRRLLTVTAETS